MSTTMRDLTKDEIPSVGGGTFGPGGIVHIAVTLIDDIGTLSGCTVGPTPVYYGPGQIANDGPSGIVCP
jgi:hypothetical protein